MGAERVQLGDPLGSDGERTVSWCVETRSSVRAA